MRRPYGNPKGPRSEVCIWGFISPNVVWKLFFTILLPIHNTWLMIRRTQNLKKKKYCLFYIPRFLLSVLRQFLSYRYAHGLLMSNYFSKTDFMHFWRLSVSKAFSAEQSIIILTKMKTYVLCSNIIRNTNIRLFSKRWVQSIIASRLSLDWGKGPLHLPGSNSATHHGSAGTPL